MKKAFSFGAEDQFCIASPRRTCKNFGAICLAPFCILLTSSAEALGGLRDSVSFLEAVPPLCSPDPVSVKKHRALTH